MNTCRGFRKVAAVKYDRRERMPLREGKRETLQHQYQLGTSPTSTKEESLAFLP